MQIKDIQKQILKLWKFVTEDIWRLVPSELSSLERRGVNLLKIISLAVRRYQADNLQRSASALTYNTFLSIIPLLAVMLAIAKGFGFQNIIESQLFEYFPGKKEIFGEVLTFVDSYMQHSKDGIFLGLGLLLLLYTVFNLISSIENAFNMIWQVPKGRTVGRRVTDYFSVFLLLPLFLLCSSGISIFMATAFETIKANEILAPFYETAIAFGPWIITLIVFTALYMFMPNTKVKFRYALPAGIFAAIGFQLFQYIYINGQIWVSKYNAIYGSFAFLPLLLLWMQLSWVICLIGAEIAYAGQNVQNFEFETDSKNISKRYLDFLILTILTLIVKRFETGGKAYMADEISLENKIPIGLTKKILYHLVDLGIILEVKDEKDYPNFQPAIDINQITLEYLFTKTDRYGSENFKIDNHKRFHSEWEVILQSRIDMFANNRNILIKDL
ncbi:MAG: YihY/virulence factor BrkB family protein [Dysgonamonadaceae bacterium]|jgi:membrane protein|nr:YihY/virulence factor BrkB family protein [Dysgonamonadaceae bacterium]